MEELSPIVQHANKSSMTANTQEMAKVTTKNEIIPGLFQGNHLSQAILLSELDVDIAVDLSIGHPPDGKCPKEEGKQYLYWVLEDSVVEDPVTLVALAKYLSVLLDHGKKIIVRCGEGHNRSGLLVATVLMVRGMKWWEAVDSIRDQHEAVALNNQRFIEWLQSLDLASV